MKAAQCLRFAQKGCQVLDRRLDQPGSLEVQMHQVQIVLNEVSEARHDLLVELRKFDFGHAIDDLLLSQLRLLIFKK